MRLASRLASAAFLLLLLSCTEETKVVTRHASPAIPLSRTAEVPIQRGEGRVSMQILVDESGSMAGFSETLPAIEAWFWRGASRASSLGYDMVDQISCGFNRSSGFVCRSPTGVRRNFRGDTNLDEAVSRVRDRDLSIILTDGVAATGGTPSAGCASGVDAACIGNQLADVIRETGRRRGVWIVPLTAAFKGDFYTERAVPAASFDLASIEGSTDEGVRVTAPRNLRTGELVYRYEGPRALIAIIVAKDENLGRAFVAGLRGALETETVPGVQTRNPAFELYPGHAPVYKWERVKRSSDWPNVAKSLVLDSVNGPALAPGNDRDHAKSKVQVARFESAASGQKPGRWELTGGAVTVPIARTTLVSLPVKDINVAHLVAGVEFIVTNASPEALSAKVNISERFAPGPCVTSSPAVSVLANRASDNLTELESYSTTTPEIQPRRVFGLNSIAQSFYPRIGDLQPLPMIELRICGKNS